MMATNMFFADLKGHSYYELWKQVLSLDRSLTSYADRKVEVDKIIEDNPYIVEYFSDYYDCHLLSNDNLSNENNICKIVEMISNYLLMSEDGRELEKREKTYYVDSRHIDRKFDKPLMINDSHNTMIVEFNKENYRLDKKQSISAKDLQEDSFCGEVLRQYKDLLNTIDEKIKSGTGNRIKLSKVKHTVNDDMVLAKDLIKGVYGYNIDSPETPNLDIYASLSEVATIKKLLTLNLDTNGAQRNKLWLLAIDFEQLLAEISLTDKERAILSLYRHQYTVREIESILGIPYRTCSFWINKIINKIANYSKTKNEKFLKTKLEGEI